LAQYERLKKIKYKIEFRENPLSKFELQLKKQVESLHARSSKWTPAYRQGVLEPDLDALRQGKRHLMTPKPETVEAVQKDLQNLLHHIVELQVQQKQASSNSSHVGNFLENNIHTSKELYLTQLERLEKIQGISTPETQELRKSFDQKVKERVQFKLETQALVDTFSTEKTQQKYSIYVLTIDEELQEVENRLKTYRAECVVSNKDHIKVLFKNEDILDGKAVEEPPQGFFKKGEFAMRHFSEEGARQMRYLLKEKWKFENTKAGSNDLSEEEICQRTIDYVEAINTEALELAIKEATEAQNDATAPILALREEILMRIYHQNQKDQNEQPGFPVVRPHGNDEEEWAIAQTQLYQLTRTELPKGMTMSNF
jgi:hypothetical protein